MELSNKKVNNNKDKKKCKKMYYFRHGHRLIFSDEKN